MIKFPSPGQEKESNARGMPRGREGGGGEGMLKLQFDWYIMLMLYQFSLECTLGGAPRRFGAN